MFVGIHGRTGEARGAVFLWQDSRDCVVERNMIIDCDTGICLGNSSRGRFPIHCTGCTVRNNFVTRAPENGILADYTRDCKILHNTIHDPTSRLQRLIRLVHDNDGLVVANNLLSGPPMRIETASKVLFRNNLIVKDLTGDFVDAAGGNLHLKIRLPDAESVEPLPEVPDDIDRQARGERTTAGADELDLDRPTVCHCFAEAVPARVSLHCLPCGKQWHTAVTSDADHVGTGLR